MKLSAIIITRNEEDKIKNCLKNLSFVDEIVVIDNQSTDRTGTIAKKEKANVYEVDGLDFAYLRNVGKEKACGEWLFYLDSDECPDKTLIASILSAVNSTADYSAYKIKRKNYFFKTLWPGFEEIVRLIKKDSLISWQGTLHEYPLISGKIGAVEGELLHYTHDDLCSMVKKTNEWSEIEAQLRFNNNHPKMNCLRFIRIMLTGFFDSYLARKSWQLGTVGLIESVYQSFSQFITYAKLWEKQNRFEIRSSKWKKRN